MTEQTEIMNPETGEVTTVEAAPPARNADPLTRFVENVVDGQMAGVISSDKVRRKFIQAATLAVHGNTLLAEASYNNPQSFAASIIKAVSLELSVDPAMGEGYLVPVWDSKVRANVIGLWLGYKGLRKLALRDPDITACYADVVFDSDYFEWQTGTTHEVIHRRDITRTKPEPADGDVLPHHIVAAYAVCRFRDGRQIVRVLARWELEKVRDDALTQGKRRKSFGPWFDHPEAMCSKSALRRLLTRDVQLSADAAEVLAHEAHEGPARRGPSVVTREARAAGSNGDIMARLG